MKSLAQIFFRVLGLEETTEGRWQVEGKRGLRGSPRGLQGREVREQKMRGGD